MCPEPSPRSWTLLGLMLAFVDLGIAYVMLFASALWLFWSNFSSLFGLRLPSPCRGMLGFVDSRLFDIPLRKIFSFHVLVRSRLPFSSICYEEQEGSFDLNKRPENSCLDSGGEANSGMGSQLVFQDRGNGDAKGKGVLSQKQQRYARRRRKVALVNGTYSSSMRNSGVAPEGMRTAIGENPSALARMVDNFPGYEKVPFASYVGDKSWHCNESSESFDAGESAYVDSFNAESSVQETAVTITDEANKMRMLEGALEEVKAAYNALFLELERERAAVATATEEAMAMISRLQNEKASMEMEVRQNLRMVDEKLAYDEDEMNILKEILVRREMENFVLENEFEAFKHMMSSDDGNSEDPQVEDAQLAVPRVEDCRMKGEKEAAGRCGKSLTYRLPQEEFQSRSSKTETSTPHETFQMNAEIDKCVSHECKELRKYEPNADEEVPQAVYDVHVDNVKTEQPMNNPGKVDPARDISSVVGMTSRRNSLDTNSVMEGPVSICDTGRSSLYSIRSERFKLDSEVEWLRDMLQKVHEEKEKLCLSADTRDKGRTDHKLLDDIRDQLKEIQRLGRPVKQTSFPPAAPKTNANRSRSQSDNAADTKESC